VIFSPFQVFNDSLPYDTESREVLDVLTPPCYDTDTDIDDFDEFIHVGRRRWDAVSYDMDPIYDIKSHLRVLPLQLSQQVLTSGNREMRFLPALCKHPRLTEYSICLMIFGLTLRPLMSTPLST
jgi:hypothetical protein